MDAVLWVLLSLGVFGGFLWLWMHESLSLTDTLSKRNRQK
jgi:hypothetical protein